MDSPAVGTVNAQGVILVFEAGNNRIHALDLYGNLVRLFSKQLVPYFLNLTATGGPNTTYLDIAAEFTGFIYVLSSSTRRSGDLPIQARYLRIGPDGFRACFDNDGVERRQGDCRLLAQRLLPKL